MPKHFKDITVKKFGRLTAIKPVGKDTCGGYKWLCKCDCGKENIVMLGNLRNGHHVRSRIPLASGMG